jgi:hypothetical protein
LDLWSIIARLSMEEGKRWLYLATGYANLNMLEI